MATIAAAALPAPRPRSLSNWLLAVAAMVLVMIVVGGITRLTESGLSITRWEPVSGVLPPMGEDGWKDAFELYRQSPQYQQVNTGMTLAEFKNIYFWEYIHRLLGRLIGFAFALPLLWFAVKGAIPKGYGWKLVALLVLGGMQGAIGWWMVASGLVDRPEVSHIRLAVHLLTAFAIFGALVWVAMDLRRLAHDETTRPVRMPTLAIWTLSLLALQALFGAYVAGLEAGYAYSSWPRMGDEWFPAEAPMFTPWLRNFVDNPIMVQFVHRWLAFVFAAAAFWLAGVAWARGLWIEALALIFAVIVQILLGIFTLLTGVDIHIAAAHQGMAALVLAAVLVAAHRLGHGRAPA